MITLITAIAPEADAILSEYPMQKIAQGTFSLYESEQLPLRLLVTGSGKLNAAMAVTEYLTNHSFSEQDIFCNLGICGSSVSTSVGEVFLCAAISELTTGRTLYPELYTHPFSEARLFTSDTPVTTDRAAIKYEGNLPVLFDMEAYGIAMALFRRVMPSRCFFYKIVSDMCDSVLPSPKDITALLRTHLGDLTDFLFKIGQQLSNRMTKKLNAEAGIASIAEKLTGDYPFSATMKHKLTGLLAYAGQIGMSEEELFQKLPKRSDTPHKKKEALALLQSLEDSVLHPSCAAESAGISSPVKKLLHPFRHIYVERNILSHPVTQCILKHFPNASIIPVNHYKDIFNRGRQDLFAEEKEPSLILAADHGTHFYPGAPVCQSFGEAHFMYTSCIMNCIYDCDYCYLQGMYPGGNLVVFVNLDDYFSELDELLKQHPVYLCCSYDSDLTALSGVFPHAEEFCRYAYKHPDLRLELRTKSAAVPFIKRLPVAKNIIMAFTLSPQELILRYEHYTPSLGARLAAAKEAARRGFPLRLCLDPILDVPNAEALYTALVDEVFTVLSPEEITDISLGVFRLSKDYLKQLRKAKPYCAISHYPYELTDGVCHYRTGRCETLLTTVRNALYNHGIQDDKLFVWAPSESGKGESNA